MNRRFFLVLSLPLLISCLLSTKLSLAEVKAPNDYPFHNLNTGLNYATLMEAIDANETQDGHTIFVDAGTYLYGGILIDKSLKIIGDGMSNTTIFGHRARGAFFNIVAENVSISGFTIKSYPEYYWGIAIGVFQNSKNNIISNNNISFESGIYLESTYKNNISKNIIESNSRAIYLMNASQNTITDNIITEGIALDDGSSDNVLVGNKMTGENGVSILYSSNNTLKNNIINCSNIGFAVRGFVLDDYFQNMDTSNTINGKPIYYWLNEHDKRVPGDAGFVAMVSSTNMTIGNLNLKDAGILLVNTTNSEIRDVSVMSHDTCIEILLGSTRNTIQNSIISSPERQGRIGIRIGLSNYTRIVNNQIVNMSNGAENIVLYNSSYNFLLENKISDSQYGIIVSSSNHSIIRGNEISHNRDPLYIWNSMNNSIYHNNLMYNTYGVTCYNSTNSWDNGYPSGGNYWSDYNGADSDYDGIGDTPYFIDANNQDNYPLMGMFSSFSTSYGYAVDFVSNSSISDVSFNLSLIEVYPQEAILTLNVSGETDAEGFLRICIPKILINGSYVIRFDNEIITNITWPLARELPCSNEAHVYFYINYTHSEHTIIITGTTLIPEFPSFLILPLFMITTLLAVIVYRRKHSF